MGALVGLDGSMRPWLRDQSQADNLNVSQTLTIELNPDDASVNAAVKFAKRREGTPDAVKKMDNEYLRAAEGK